MNAPNTGRFDYVKYDQQANEAQAIAKDMVTQVENFINTNLQSPRAKASALTYLEITYMWIGKAIRDDQIMRNGSAPLNEGRDNS